VAADREHRSPNFCPQCGAAVASAETVRADDAIQLQGVFSADERDAHLVVDGDEIRIFEHDSQAGEAA
jgi:hypothetical protein